MPNGKTYTYIVEQTEIVDSDDELRIPIIEGKHLILATCYPFYYSGHAPKQFVVGNITVPDKDIKIAGRSTGSEEDPDEYAEVEEVFNAFQDDPKIQDLKEEKK